MAKEMKEVLVHYTETYGDEFTLFVPKDATPEQMEESWHEAVSNGDISLEKVEMIESDYVFEEIGAEDEQKQEKKADELPGLLDKLVYRTDYELLKEYKEALHTNKTASLDAFSELYDLLDLLDAIGKAAGLSAEKIEEMP